MLLPFLPCQEDPLARGFESMLRSVGSLRRCEHHLAAAEACPVDTVSLPNTWQFGPFP